jgi:hypothetical protein
MPYSSHAKVRVVTWCLSSYSGSLGHTPLFFASPRWRNSRISAVEAMPLADNFLQKQQKQRKGRSKNGRVLTSLGHFGVV